LAYLVGATVAFGLDMWWLHQSWDTAVGFALFVTVGGAIVDGVAAHLRAKRTRLSTQ
jgi:hypothetical protein